MLKCTRNVNLLATYNGHCVHLFVNSDVLKVIYHHLYIMNKFVTNKSKFPQDGAQVFHYMG